MNTLVRWGGPILQQAVVLGVFACLVVIPLVGFIHWRKTGRAGGSWLWITPLVTMYAVGVISFTFLPLPDSNILKCGSSVYYPRFFAGWSLRSAWNATEGLGMLRFFTWPFVQIYMNILLFVPFGIFARWLLGAGFRSVLLAGFATTLLIELTQLTGIWGYFNCRYRTFDVDDMIFNTLGAVLGWALVMAWDCWRGRKSGMTTLL
ncbi:VanZ family protein [Rothia aerolata]|uniref:VanZ-like domain-containing protein n=1 Tax=Rothia aerolata TaxID=1812262 RepID=A0A917IZ94_9MICC|nr:VanZ family protein [Rothia aerolata]GGH66118.1 hypothetical protein GCM10007359_20040 [Rothia aerolata]